MGSRDGLLLDGSFLKGVITLNYFFLYETSTGAIVQPPQLSASNPWPNPPSTWSVLSFAQATAASDVVMAYTYPQRYLILGSPAALVLQPYFTLSASDSSDTYTVTATLNNPSSTPPTDVTFTFLGQSASVALSSNQAVLTLTFDSMVATQSATVAASATGCVSATVTLGAGGASSLQAIAPSTTGNTSTTAWRVCTTSKAAAAEYYLAQSQADLAAILGSLQVFVQMMVSDLYKSGGVIESLKQAAYTPITVSTDAANALSDIQANLLPSVGWTLDSIYPSGGTPQYHYTSTKTHIPGTTSAAQEYAKFAEGTPGLV